MVPLYRDSPWTPTHNTHAILEVLLIPSVDDAINTHILCYHFYFDNLFLDPKT